METLLTIVHIFVSVVLILVVLLQAGRGGGMGATFGGASQQIFGGRGAGSFLTRVTTVCAVVFFLTSLTLAMMSSRERSALEKKLAPKTEETTPDAAKTTDAAPDTAAPAASPEAAPAAEVAPEAAPAPATK
ncbi:MAG: preprotein translocase subunit SecG [Deltaproteobacteria bacterium]|nr:preprotein translocase subunit SecG [Deltaproteobacteria bacterium]